MDKIEGINSSEITAEIQEIESKPWWSLGLPILIGILVLALGSGSASTWIFGLTQFFIAVAATSVGGLLGFLFGMPRSIIASGDTGSPNDGRGTLAYRPSTNLEQISDWLTKLLIGVGLVELRSIGDALDRFGTLVQASVDPPLSSASVITQAAVISFVALAFLTSFLWTRIYYGPLQMRTDRGVLSSLSQKFDFIEAELQIQKTETEKAFNVTRMLASGELTAPTAATGRSELTADEITRAVASWPEDVRKGYENYLRAPREWDSDPGAKFFSGAPRSKDGLTLAGEIIETLPDVLIIQLTVKSTIEPADGGVVSFLLHPTLSTPTRHVYSGRAGAEIKFSSQGWFTAVAIANEGLTVLALDLRTIPNAPDWFKI